MQCSRRAAPQAAGQRIFPAGMARAFARLGGSIIAPVGIPPAALFALAFLRLAPAAFLRAFVAMAVILSRRVRFNALRTAVAIRALARLAFAANAGSACRTAARVALFTTPRSESSSSLLTTRTASGLCGSERAACAAATRRGGGGIERRRLGFLDRGREKQNVALEIVLEQG